MVVHQLSKRRSQVIGFKLTVHVFKSHSYMAWILFVPIEIPPDMLLEKSIYFICPLSLELLSAYNTFS